ncbi:cold-shock protein [Micromonospora sp. KC721]|uniref:cold-shock protein n=1 Tax=Micromonospora sp. KC721 TaxID=2530380 RepID=UPI00104F823F|nr:cold shock domain-containing protein [Micromonospora sp. KC721]TDB79780.1 cold shock domain-containing protein [Micromonospora sp. KC721]
MRLIGSVREYHVDQGWGVRDAPETPGGAWVHFSEVRTPGFRALTAGQTVTFEVEPACQDGYAHRALRVRPVGHDDSDETGAFPRSVAYSSSLVIAHDDPPPTSPPD